MLLKIITAENRSRHFHEQQLAAALETLLQWAGSKSIPFQEKA